MRLSVQGCLILLLCFSHSAYSAMSKPEAKAACEAYSASNTPGGVVSRCLDNSDRSNGAYDYQWQYDESSPYYPGWIYRTTFLYDPTICNPPYVIDPISGDCSVVQPSTPSECREVGELYDPATTLCVTECPSGALNGVCLKSLEPDPDSCNSSSEDWRGDVDQGFGNPPLSICGDTSCTIGDAPGQSGIFNGELVCLSQDYGAPKCQGDTITVIDEYGFICAGIDPPEEPETPEEPNEDTTGDGEPDTYNPDSDPNINRKQLDDLKDGQGKSNQSLSNLEELGKGSNKRLDGIGEALDLQNELSGDANRSLRDIEKNTGGAADALDDINQGMAEPDGGYSLGELLDIPTLTESASVFKANILGTSAGQFVSGLSDLPSSTNCPVYTFPASDYWSSTDLTFHCNIINEHRSIFSVMFMFFWSVTALFVFLKG